MLALYSVIFSDLLTSESSTWDRCEPRTDSLIRHVKSKRRSTGKLLLLISTIININTH